MRSSLKKILTSSTFISCALMSMGFSVLLAGILYFGAVAQQKTDEARDANAGFGSGDHPIPAGAWVVLDSFRLRLNQIVYKADAQVRNASATNLSAANGYEYLLLQLEVECTSEACFGEAIAAVLQLYDATGKAYPVATVTLDDYFMAGSAENSGRFDGWLAYQLPLDRQVALYSINWDGTLLYAYPPNF